MSCVEIVDENTTKRHAPRVTRNGYALLLVMFFLALLVIAVAAAAPNIITQGRREKEEEMIWRGKQYVRGIRLFYQRTHHFPTQLEDLCKPKTGIRFMRQAYKDPTNTVDGSWRLISVGPSGQLIGSLKEHPNAFFFGAPAPASFAGALSASSSGASKNPFSSPSTSSGSSLPDPTSSSSQNSSNSAGDAAKTVNASSDQDAPSPDSGHAISTPQSIADPSENGPTLGQTIIIGVGSKVDKGSIVRYEGANNYLQFEFIWNGLNPGLGTPSP